MTKEGKELLRDGLIGSLENTGKKKVFSKTKVRQ